MSGCFAYTQDPDMQLTFDLMVKFRGFLSGPFLSESAREARACASDFLPITVFVSIRRINEFVFTNVYLPLFKYFSFAPITLFDVWYFQNNSESFINEVKTRRRSTRMLIWKPHGNGLAWFPGPAMLLPLVREPGDQARPCVYGLFREWWINKRDHNSWKYFWNKSVVYFLSFTKKTYLILRTTYQNNLFLVRRSCPSNESDEVHHL